MESRRGKGVEGRKGMGIENETKYKTATEEKKEAREKGGIGWSWGGRE